ncbi:hypothetical protein O4H49_18370 [Kiloniella laminariae]|uniref:DUF4350 domain-containing protein n=1 Tax=Kiloniella laminariae TaxID=454162 RepID=A0ABT4LNN4_9PROT|nr:DUF4350 domain-containing protein [Kiloniella laminariae]MCZ4282755.1 hypothetical protein [Kiloniella laminariae]
MDDRIFSSRTLLWLVLIGILSFAGAFVASLYQDKIIHLSSIGTNSYSQSAIGHNAFSSLMKKMDYRVRTSRKTWDRAGYADVTLLIEPEDTMGVEAVLEEFYGAGTLVVLPKWHAYPDPENEKWVRSARLKSDGEVENILQIFSDRIELIRGAPEDVLENFTWDKDILTFSQQPWIQAPQLIQGSDDILRPLVYSDKGILLAEFIQPNGLLDGIDKTWILSDPDILSNHGLDNGGNAYLAIGIIDVLTGNGLGGVVIDETSHGYVSEPSLWRRMFEFPFAVVTLLLVATVGLLGWSSISRFGPPQITEKSYQSGKGFLIDNTADLLAFGGHGALMLKHYAERSLQTVALGLHAPKDLEEYELLQWLDRVGQARGSDLISHEIIRNAHSITEAPVFEVMQALKAARDIHRWKQEMLHGTG